jgi:hypothetical protein
VGAFLGESVEVGRFKEFRRFFHETHEVIPVVVAEDDNNVLAIYLFGEKDLK